MSQLLILAIAILFAFVFGMQVLVRVRARAMQGRPLPALGGSVGKRIQTARSALVYFMSPQCGACRSWTPKVEALRKKNSDVFVVDVSQDFSLARALKVMATPSAIEIREGRVAGYHVGSIPADVLARFT